MTDEWVARPPVAGLRPIIDRYVGYRLTGFPPGLHRGLPSRHMTLIVSIGPPIDVVAQTSRRQSPQTYRCVLSGLQATTALIAHDGRQEGVAIELTPLGSRALLGMPAGELWDCSLELADVVGAPGGELWERLQPTTGWGERFAVCDEILSLLAGADIVAPELRRCWAALVHSGGRLAVHDLADRTGYSRQHLARRFRAEFGLGPKLAARVIRFERARQMLQSVPPFVSITQVAAACGYYDQAHLYRDFAQFTGCTPAEVLNDITHPEDLDAPFFQDRQVTGQSDWWHERHRTHGRVADPQLP